MHGEELLDPCQLYLRYPPYLNFPRKLEKGKVVYVNRAWSIRKEARTCPTGFLKQQSSDSKLPGSIIPQPGF